MKEKKQKSLIWITLIIILGFIAGTAGSIISRTYLNEKLNLSFFSNTLELDNLNYDRVGLVIQGAKNIVVNQEIKVEETLNKLEDSLFSIFIRGTDSELLSTTITNIQDIPVRYYLHSPKFTALALTSDGWLLTLIPDDFTNFDFDIKNYFAIDSNQKIYNLEKFIPLTEFSAKIALIKLADADNLIIKKIANQADLFLGQTVIALNNQQQLFVSSFSAINKQTELSSSDEFYLNLELNNLPSSDFTNSFIFNLAGDLLAIIDHDLQVKPVYLYSNYWQNLIINNVEGIASLGVNYLDLGLVYIPGLTQRGGAWLLNDGTKLAVEKNSPAELAGLRAGDIITRINNYELSNNLSLAQIVNEFKPGTTITVTYLREAEEHQVNIKLAEKKINNP